MASAVRLAADDEAGSGCGDEEMPTKHSTNGGLGRSLADSYGADGLFAADCAAGIERDREQRTTAESLPQPDSLPTEFLPEPKLASDCRQRFRARTLTLAIRFRRFWMSP